MLHPFEIKIYNEIISSDLYNKESYTVLRKEDRNGYGLEVPILSFNYKDESFDVGDVFFDKEKNKLYIFSLLKEDNYKMIKAVGFKCFDELKTSNNISILSFFYFEELDLNNFVFITNVFYNDKNRHMLLQKYLKKIYPNTDNFYIKNITDAIDYYKITQTNFYLKIENKNKIIKFNEFNIDLWFENPNKFFTIHFTIKYFHNKNGHLYSYIKNFYLGDLFILKNEIKEKKNELLFLTISKETGKVIVMNKEKEIFKENIFFNVIDYNNYDIINLFKKNTKEHEDLYDDYYIKLI